jgi:hypothetical protein
MTHKIYRRLVFLMMMLLMAISLMNSPTSTAAVRETCEECNAVCDETLYGCLEHGNSMLYCSALARPCYIHCFYDICPGD